MAEKLLYEDQDREKYEPDPDESPIGGRKLFTQPYDLTIASLIGQIKDNTLHLRPLSDRPLFQRKYVWTDRLAYLLIESILLNVPIPPCYFAQNEEFELDVIDGQQRIFSIYRFLNNQFVLSGLEVLTEENGKRFHELDLQLQRKIKTHTLRAVVITNDSHPEIQFDVFQRLNTNTVPLNAQELRNCIFRGPLNTLLGKLAKYEPWLEILGRKAPDQRLRDEELILRFFAFYIKGVDSYRTPQKHWLNDVAKDGRKFSEEEIEKLQIIWCSTIDKCIIVFAPNECFRRFPPSGKRQVINRALMDLLQLTMSRHSIKEVQDISAGFRQAYASLFDNEDFQDLISRAVDHKSRTRKRFEIWEERLVREIF